MSHFYLDNEKQFVNCETRNVFNFFCFSQSPDSGCTSCSLTASWVLSSFFLHKKYTWHSVSSSTISNVIPDQQIVNNMLERGNYVDNIELCFISQHIADLPCLFTTAVISVMLRRHLGYISSHPLLPSLPACNVKETKLVTQRLMPAN